MENEIATEYRRLGGRKQDRSKSKDAPEVHRLATKLYASRSTPVNRVRLAHEGTSASLTAQTCSVKMHLLTEFSFTKRISRWEWLVPGAIAAVLVLWCVLISPKKPVWFDEVITWIIATDPSPRHSIFNPVDVAPTYYIVAQLWRHIFGSSLLALRLLSCFGFSVAVFVSWAALRRSFTVASTAFALVAVFCTSALVLPEDVELRFYGVLTGLVAFAVLLFGRLAATAKPSTKLLIITGLCHAALVLCHIYGLLYSGTILAALVLFDAFCGKVRIRTYVPIMAGWLPFLFRIVPLVHLTRISRTHSWRHAPPVGDLLSVYAWPTLPFLVGLVCLVLLLFNNGSKQSGRPAIRILFLALGALSLAAVALGGSGTHWNEISVLVLAITAVLAWQLPSARQLTTKPLLYLASALLSMPLLVFLCAQFLPPMFETRYFIPIIFAMAIQLAAFLENAIAWFPPSTILPKAALAAGLVSLMGAAVYGAPKLPANDAPADSVSPSKLHQLITASLPIAVEDGFTFLPLYFQERGSARRYVYVLNRETTEASSYSVAVINYDQLERLRAYGYLRDHVVTQQAFLTDNPNFLVLHKPGYAWFDRTLANNSGYIWRTLGQVNGSVLIEISRTKLSGSANYRR